MPPSTLKAVPPVSLGLPVLNGEEFLAPTLDSILAQTYSDFELVISDNASTDSTQDIVRHYAARDPRIRYFRQAANVGVGNNYTCVARRARSPLFKWLSANDEYALGLLADCSRSCARILALSFAMDGPSSSIGRVGDLGYTMEISTRER